VAETAKKFVLSLNAKAGQGIPVEGVGLPGQRVPLLWQSFFAKLETFRVG